MHIFVIMAFFHALAGFCLGCGLNPEIDTELGHTISDQSDTPMTQYTNPALGMAGTGSDSEPSSGAISPACSPPSEQVSKYLVEHYIESKEEREGGREGGREGERRRGREGERRRGRERGRGEI